MYKSAVALAVLVALAALPASAALPQKADNQIRITFVNVGAGLCTVIECPGSQVATSAILYDCGSMKAKGALTEAAAVGFVLEILSKSYLALPIVVVSHPDTDHSNYISEIIKKRGAEFIWLGGDTNAYHWVNDTKIASKGFFKEESGKKNELTCGNASVEILTVNAGKTNNDQSMVLRIQYKNFSATMTGDATGKTLENIKDKFRNKPDQLATTLLSAPHHGAGTEKSDNPDWPKLFKPEIVVYSAGAKFHHPACSAKKVYEDYGTLRNAHGHPIRCGENKNYTEDNDYVRAQYLTYTDGSISVTADGETTLQVSCDGIFKGNPIDCSLN